MLSVPEQVLRHSRTISTMMALGISAHRSSVTQNHEEQRNKHRKLGALVNIPIAAPTVAHDGAVPTSSSPLQGSDGCLGLNSHTWEEQSQQLPWEMCSRLWERNSSSLLPHQDFTGNYLHPTPTHDPRNIPQPLPNLRAALGGIAGSFGKFPHGMFPSLPVPQNPFSSISLSQGHTRNGAARAGRGFVAAQFEPRQSISVC